MKIKLAPFILILLFFIGLSHAGDLQLDGNLNVGGSLVVSNKFTAVGTSLFASTNNFGAFRDVPSIPSLQLYANDVDGAGNYTGAGHVTMHASRWAAVWTWEHESQTGPVRQMRLNGEHQLELWSADTNQATASIMLNSQGVSTFKNGITVSGPIRITPQGDLSMGSFTNSPPAP
jgi:hypothetical protein